MKSQREKELDEAIDATQKFRRQASQEQYSKLKSEREKATFSMMMKMNPEALTNIRKEFFARRDSVTLDEFIYIIQKHLINKPGDDGFVMETPDQREFGTNMYELFKDIDVNGDRMLEWQEFTSFTVEKANLLNKRAKLTSIAHYHDSSSSLDPSARYRHRHDISKFVKIPSLGQFAMLEENKNSVFVFNARLGKHIGTINTESAPIAIESIREVDRESLVTASADMTLSTFSLDDPNPKKRYKVQSTWATPGVQMALAYAQDNRLLYSGATNGSIYSWNVHDRSLVTSLPGHSDIVMSLIVLQKLNNIASASLDKTIGVWDSHTNEQILRLHGHRKGVFDLTYNPTYRLIFSCGFEHDACVWSPFVNNLVFRLKGHHASLVGCQSVDKSPEVITADTSGVFKLWDVRNFQCVQTFSANLSGQETKDSSKLAAFFHYKLPSRNTLQKEDDSRIYASSKMLFSFDQARVVHEATTDYTNVFWVSWNPDNSVIITASERNVIIWDSLIGSKTFTHTNICGEEISACCLDDRKRKILIGDVVGKIGVYNYSNGALMKTVHHVVPSIVVGLQYYDEAKRFIAGYANGLISIYDENVLEECLLVRSFESYNQHPELLTFSFDPSTRTAASAGGSSGIARLWDYDSGKCDSELVVCRNKDAHIVSLTMLLPYPLVVTADSDGILTVWGSRGCRWQGKRISGFMNMIPVNAEYEPMLRRADAEEKANRRALPPAIPDDEAATHLASISELDQINTLSTLTPPKSPVGNMVASMSFASALSKDFWDEENSVQADLLKRRDSMIQAKQAFDDSEGKWGRVAAAQTLGWNPESFQLFAGDDLGWLRCFSLKDVLRDLQAEKLLEPGSHHNVLGLCGLRTRNARSALAAVEEEPSKYLLGNKFDVTAYQGVEFEWALTAHTDRIMSCTCTPHGLLTSAADRLVKMWTFDGRPVGTLLQSVPVGQRSRSWDLVLDVDEIIAKENKELDEIIKNVTDLSLQPGKPNIARMDFTGMQLGAESAYFSRSVLRQRIEKTTKILGIDFPTQKALNTVNSLPSPLKSGSTFDDRTAVSDHTSPTHASKSLVDALREIKSTESGVNYEQKTKQMSYFQQKRKANKLDEISKSYEAKTGVHIKSNHVKHEGLIDKETKEEEEKSKKDLEKLISSSTSVSHQKDESTINSDLYSFKSLNKTKTKNNQFVALPKSKLQDKRVSKIAISIKLAQENGPRTIFINNSCKKFSTYDALDTAIKSKPKVSIDKEEIKKRRQKIIMEKLEKDELSEDSFEVLKSVPVSSRKQQQEEVEEEVQKGFLPPIQGGTPRESKEFENNVIETNEVQEVENLS